MISKESILEKTQRGLAVFQHFLPITHEWQVGKNFHNPFYDDKKAACNVYFDKHSNQYRFKDFGDNAYEGDCFWLVAQLHHLEVSDRADFQAVLRLIDEQLHLGLEVGFKTDLKTPFSKNNYPNPPLRLASSVNAKVFEDFVYKPAKTDEVARPFDLETMAMTDVNFRFWGQYGINEKVLTKYHVVSVKRFSTTNKEGKPYSISSSDSEPIFGYQPLGGPNKNCVKLYRPMSEQRFQFLGQKPESYIFGLDHLPPRGDVLFITGGEKDVLSLSAHGFSAICFNSESASIPAETIKKLSYRFRHIVLLYDVDKAGIEAVRHHLNNLKELEIKHLTLPLVGTKEEKDVSDYFRMGKTAEDLRRLFNLLLENLYSQTFAMLKSCEIDFQNPPQTPEPLITIAGVTIGSPGNLLGITGNEGSGKSNFLGGMLAGALGTHQTDSLGTKVSQNHKGKSVLYFDTEQSEDQLFRNLQIVLKRTELDKPPKWFRAYCLTNLSRRERLQVILQSVDKFHHQHGGVHLVVIDGIGDLISSLNDERESISLIEELHRMAGIYQTCILCVLHLVPNGVKLRGHLGSELQRKSSGILCIEKDENTDVSCVKALKVRSGSPLDVPLIQFAWDKELGYHTYIGEKSKEMKQQRKLEDLTAFAKNAFEKAETLTYTELMNLLAETMGVKERMARNYIQFMLDKGLVEQGKNKHFFLLKMTRF
jgi:AAA domain/Toprim-like